MRFSCMMLLGLAALAALVTAAPGQANPDEVIVTLNSATYLLAVEPNGMVKTFCNTGLRAQCITEDLYNDGVLFGTSASPGDLIRVSMTGVAHTLVVGGPYVVDLDVDGDGNWMGAGFGTGGKQQNAVFTISPTGTITTLIQGGAPFGKIYAMGLDMASGDVVVFDGAGYLLRITRTTPPVVTTLISSLTTGGSGGLHPLHGAHGQLIGVWNNTTVYRITLNAPNPLTTIFNGSPFTWLADVEYEPATGLYLIADLKNTQGAIYRFDPHAAAVTTLVNLSGVRPTQIAVVGGRHLSAVGPAKVGQPFAMKVSMPTYPGAFYVTALSFGCTPGLTLPGGLKVWLAPDTLFSLSLTNMPPLFNGFQGTLSAQGAAGPTLNIPNVPLLAGLRLFAGAVAFHGPTPLRASEPLGFTVQP
ncbi:MAG: hypothetical protein JXQ29_00375 [Planctomycetes bacterium]|nr:hypothetical protein [Planctomycetota bacterium]